MEDSDRREWKSMSVFFFRFCPALLAGRVPPPPPITYWSNIQYFIFLFQENYQNWGLTVGATSYRKIPQLILSIFDARTNAPQTCKEGRGGWRQKRENLGYYFLAVSQTRTEIFTSWFNCDRLVSKKIYYSHTPPC